LGVCFTLEKLLLDKIQVQILDPRHRPILAMVPDKDLDRQVGTGTGNIATHLHIAKVSFQEWSLKCKSFILRQVLFMQMFCFKTGLIYAKVSF
jgi:hypothetical protein